jgi:hypothetical protein
MPTCRPGSSVLDGLQPGDKRNTAKVAKDTSTSPLVVSNRGARHQRFGTGTTSDRTPGPRAGTTLPLSHRRPTPTAVPCTTQTVHRGTVNVGTWNVRGLKVQKHVHKPVDVSLTLQRHVCAIQETWLDPQYTVMTPGFSCRDCWVRN